MKKVTRTLPDGLKIDFYTRPMKNPEKYIDIGHGDPSAFLWVYYGGKIVAFRALTATHETLWGTSAMNMWRGRYDEKKGELSIIAPQMLKIKTPPSYLVDLLQERFGGDIEFWEFNPNAKKVAKRR